LGWERGNVGVIFRGEDAKIEKVKSKYDRQPDSEFERIVGNSSSTGSGERSCLRSWTEIMAKG